MAFIKFIQVFLFTIGILLKVTFTVHASKMPQLDEIDNKLQIAKATTIGLFEPFLLKIEEKNNILNEKGKKKGKKILTFHQKELYKYLSWKCSLARDYPKIKEVITSLVDVNKSSLNSTLIENINSYFLEILYKDEQSLIEINKNIREMSLIERYGEPQSLKINIKCNSCDKTWISFTKIGGSRVAECLLCGHEESLDIHSLNNRENYAEEEGNEKITSCPLKGNYSDTELLKDNIVEVAASPFKSPIDPILEFLERSITGGTYGSSLDLHGYNIKETHILRLGKLLEKDSKITSINLSNTEIGDLETAYFAAFLERLSNLISLDVSNNKIGEMGGQCLIEAVTKNENLIEVNIKGNQIDKVIMEKVEKVLFSRKLPKKNFIYQAIKEKESLENVLREIQINKASLNRYIHEIYSDKERQLEEQDIYFLKEKWHRKGPYNK